MAVWKFLDDFLAGERIPIDQGQRIIKQNKEECCLHAKESEAFFNVVAENAAKVGMRVNEDKTQILCVSSALNSNVSSFINLPNGVEKPS